MAILIRPAKRVKKIRTKRAEEILARLQSYLDDNIDEPVRMLCGFWQDQQDAITYQELREAVKEGAMNEEIFRLWTQDYSVLVTSKMRNIWEGAIQGGSMSQPVMNGLAFEFNTQTPGIMNWISERGAEFVTSSTIEQKEAIKALLAKKAVEGHTVDELSRLIRPCIGLTEGQAKANLRYYDNVVSTMKKDHPRMKPESVKKKALDAATKYAERQHRQRAFDIAQTEMAFAYNKGADEGVRQAQSQGLLGTMIKRWCTSGDDSVCPICSSLEGTEIDMDDDFSYKGRVLFSGQKMLPPAHPRCACAVEYIEMR